MITGVSEMPSEVYIRQRQACLEKDYADWKMRMGGEERITPYKGESKVAPSRSGNIVNTSVSTGTFTVVLPSTMTTRDPVGFRARYATAVD
jgi:hypothetical protein